MRMLSLILVAFFGSAAMARSMARVDIELQVPILLNTSQGNTIHNISDFSKQLAKKGLEIPDYVIIKDRKDQEEWSKYSAPIDEAGLEKPKGNSLYMYQYGRISDYYGKNIKFPICYRNVGTGSARKAAEAAYKLVSEMGDGVLSDQHTILAYRIFGDEEFTNENGDENEMDWLKKYKKVELAEGDIQVIAVTNDSGDDDGSDVLSLCADEE